MCKPWNATSASMLITSTLIATTRQIRKMCTSSIRGIWIVIRPGKKMTREILSRRARWSCRLIIQELNVITCVRMMDTTHIWLCIQKLNRFVQSAHIIKYQSTVDFTSMRKWTTRSTWASCSPSTSKSNALSHSGARMEDQSSVRAASLGRPQVGASKPHSKLVRHQNIWTVRPLRRLNISSPIQTLSSTMAMLNSSIELTPKWSMANW